MGKAQDDYNSLSELVDRLFDDDDSDGKQKWINAHMGRLGHKPTVSWTDGDDDGNKDDFASNLFGKPRERREVSRGGSRQKKDSADWQYGS